MRTLTLLLAFGLAQTACAAGVLRDGRTLEAVEPSQMAGAVEPGTILILGEFHDSASHHANQREILRLLGDRGMKVSVGLEFFERPHQAAVDRWLEGSLGEGDFLREIGWGKIPFDLYREQAQFPGTHGGKTLALNASRALTGVISKKGIEGLTDEEKAQLPPGFELGSGTYFERFRETMAGHVPDSAIARYFEAQSTWDDTMAWTATEYLRAASEQVLVILVGDFHAAYGDGLAHRLRERGASRVLLISQVADEEEAAVHPIWGARGDYVWVAR
jgi:uncharacterized iron-regulated protein